MPCDLTTQKENNTPSPTSFLRVARRYVTDTPMVLSGRKETAQSRCWRDLNRNLVGKCTQKRLSPEEKQAIMNS